MRLSYGLFLALLGSTSSVTARRRDYDLYDYYTIQVEEKISPLDIAAALGLSYEGRVGELVDHHTFSIPKASQHQIDEILEELKSRKRKRQSGLDAVANSIRWSQKLKLKPRMQKRGTIPPAPRAPPPLPGFAGAPAPDEAAVAQRQAIAKQLSIRDPIFADQWHLYNAVNVGHDINVTGVWMQGITGHNATAVVVDDGLDLYSEDLKDNYFAEGSYDFNDQTDEPKPRLADDLHGTRCAGEIAAVRNNVCGVGVAYDSRIAGLRILSKVISDEDEAIAINYEMQKNHIYSCSWGPPDDGSSMEGPGILIRKAMLNGVQNGRGGKGSIFVFAAGNGAAAEDNCNFDGYTNSIYSITIGAIDHKGQRTHYSEACSAQMAVTYSSGDGSYIHTTGVGANKCYSNHGGTSAAAPLGAGIFALALSVRPELTWRDMQYLCVQTAVQFNEEQGGWVDTFIGKKFSHVFGYGKLDAWALVEAAKTFESVKPQAWYMSPWQHVKHDIPQGLEGLSSTFPVTEDALKDANFEKVEQITVTMNINHTQRGDLSVELISPEGVTSHLSTTRDGDNAKAGYVDWTFMSVAHWGEPGVGNWTVIVKDTKENDSNGTFIDWRLKLWGLCIDASKQKLLPMPTEHDDDDHDAITAIVGTTTVAPVTSPTPASTTPTEHISRPVNEKPTSIIATLTTELLTILSTPSASFTAETSPTSASAMATATPSATADSNESFLPHYFPTFGVSKRTQIWIYGAFALIVVFCLCLGITFWILRRTRARTSRSDYEFDVLNGNDTDGARGALTGGRRNKRTRRAGELYDAFAGESDEEIFSDVEGEGEYKDAEPARGSPGHSTGALSEKGTHQ